MRGTEKIIAHIQADAKAQADAVLAQAQQQCDGIRQRWQAEADAVYAARLSAGKEEIRAQRDSVERIARLEGRKALLQVRQDMVSAGFDKARDQLNTLPREKYCALLTRLAADAAVTGDEELVFNSRDRASVGAEVVKAANAALAAAGKAGGLRLSEAEGSFSGGLVLRRGSIETNCTTDLLVELCRGEMSARLAAVLFE